MKIKIENSSDKAKLVVSSHSDFFKELILILKKSDINTLKYNTVISGSDLEKVKVTIRKRIDSKLEDYAIINGRGISKMYKNELLKLNPIDSTHNIVYILLCLLDIANKKECIYITKVTSEDTPFDGT